MEDPAVTTALEARIEALMAGSDRNPAWQESARHRQWMRRWPGVLSV